MVRTSRKIFCILMLATYVFFYASSNFFYHTHIQFNSIVVHSHPFGDKAHNHTTNQIQILDIIASAVYESSENVTAPEFFAEFSDILELSLKHGEPQLDNHSFVSLRAPPKDC